jgi:hypothetical protein
MGLRGLKLPGVLLATCVPRPGIARVTSVGRWRDGAGGSGSECGVEEGGDDGRLGGRQTAGGAKIPCRRSDAGLEEGRATALGFARRHLRRIVGAQVREALRERTAVLFGEIGCRGIARGDVALAVAAAGDCRELRDRGGEAQDQSEGTSHVEPPGRWRAGPTRRRAGNRRRSPSATPCRDLIAESQGRSRGSRVFDCASLDASSDGGSAARKKSKRGGVRNEST